MKNLNLMLIALAVMLSGLSVFAQVTRPEFTPEQWYATHPEALTPEQILAKLSTKSGNAVAQSSPGDEKVVVMDTSAQFVRKGQTFQAQLVAIKSLSEPVVVFGRIFYPSDSGRYDEQGRVSYFNAQSGIGFGHFPRGLEWGQVIELYSPRITDDFKFGEHILDVSVIGQNGQLIQQVFGRFFVSYAGPYGRFSYRLESGRLEGTTAQKILRLEGSFPIGEQVLIYFGLPGRGHDLYQGASRDGQTISVPIQFGAGRDQAVNAVAMFSSIRESSAIQIQVKADLKQ